MLLLCELQSSKLDSSPSLSESSSVMCVGVVVVVVVMCTSIALLDVFAMLAGLLCLKCSIACSLSCLLSYLPALLLVCLLVC